MGNSPWTFFVCFGVSLLPVLAVVIVWMFFRSAVRSGVRQGAPKPSDPVIVAPPAAPVITEAQIREIVRDEIRRLRAARGSAGPSSGSPR